MEISGFILFIFSAFLLLFGISYFVVNEILKLLNVKKTSKKPLYYSLLVVPFLFLLQFLNILLEIKFINELFFILIVVLLYSLPIVLFVKIIGKILKLNSKRQIILICLFLIAFLCIGIYTAQTYEIKNIEITSDKISKEYKLVLISDLHIGSESPDYLAEIVNKIIDLNPDMVFITGDLVDSSRISIQDIDPLNNLSMPVFFIFGNHEHYANKTKSFFNEIKSLNILNNELEELEELEIIGLNYYLGNYGHIDIAETLEILNINKSKFTILLNHEPSQVDSVADSKIDLMLAGHWHGGQIYPFNYLIKSRIDYIYGLYSIGNTSLYVTSGTGVWGPNMRLGTKNEIVQIKLAPSDTKEQQKDNSNVRQINQPGVLDINQEEENLSNSTTLNNLQPPLDKADERVNKKKFGVYITPQNSPVQPERFKGFHAGVDFEVFSEELNTEVSVYAICSGKIKLKQYVSGYGGIAAQTCELNKEPITIIYGHLKLSSITVNIDENIEAGERIGILGADKSQETDYERKHLHLGIYKGIEVNIKGYVGSQSELLNWIDPCLHICHN